MRVLCDLLDIVEQMNTQWLFMPTIPPLSPTTAAYFPARDHGEDLVDLAQIDNAVAQSSGTAQHAKNFNLALNFGIAPFAVWSKAISEKKGA